MNICIVVMEVVITFLVHVKSCETCGHNIIYDIMLFIE